MLFRNGTHMVDVANMYAESDPVWVVAFLDPGSESYGARYTGEGAYAAYRAPKVDLLIHFLYRDEPSLARFQSGLVSLSNRVKPAYAAFELPLAQISRSTLWGQFRAPAAGSTGRLEQRAGSGWRTLAAVHGGAGGYFRWTGKLAPGTQVRLRAGSVTGPAITVR